ncbi:MAG: putative tellurite resistance protein B-like protein, partial [Patiriisocius sp.]
MDKNKQALLSDLIVIAKADNKVTIEEYDFIMSIAARMEIDSDTVKILFENPLPSKTPRTEFERITHFYKMILMMHIDNEADESEIEVIRNFGLKMGIRQGVVDQMLHKMEQY